MFRKLLGITLSHNQLYFLKFYFQLEDNCFIILCWFLPFINMNQSLVYTHPLPPQPPSPSHQLDVFVQFYSNMPFANGKKEMENISWKIC